MEIRKRVGTYVPKRSSTASRPRARPSTTETSRDVKLFNQLIGASVIIVLSVFVNWTGGNVEKNLSLSWKKHTTLSEINTNLLSATQSIPVLGKFFQEMDTIPVFEDLFGKQALEEDADMGDTTIRTSTVVVDQEAMPPMPTFTSGFDLEKYKQLPSTTEEIEAEPKKTANGEPSALTLGSPFDTLLPEEISVMTTLPEYLREKNPYSTLSYTFFGTNTAEDEELPEIVLESPKIPDNVILEKIKLPISLSYPLNGQISSKFGIRNDPFAKNITFHHGLDIAAAKGTTIRPIASGQVITVGKNSVYGNYIVVKHSNDIVSKYAHCTKIVAKKGDKVKASTKIATVGSTGASTGNHVHLEIRYGSKFIDPLLHLTK